MLIGVLLYKMSLPFRRQVLVQKFMSVFTLSGRWNNMNYLVMVCFLFEIQRCWILFFIDMLPKLMSLCLYVSGESDCSRLFDWVINIHIEVSCIDSINFISLIKYSASYFRTQLNKPLSVGNPLRFNQFLETTISVSLLGNNVQDTVRQWRFSYRLPK